MEFYPHFLEHGWNYVSLPNPKIYKTKIVDITQKDATAMLVGDPDKIDSFIELMKPQFDKEIVKESLKFTGKQWAGGQVTGLIGYFINLYVIFLL